MKIIFAIFLMILFYLFGWLAKRKYVLRLALASEMLDFVKIYDMNLSVFKTDISSVVELYYNNNKNVKKFNFFVKINNLLKFDEELTNTYFSGFNECNLIKQYFFNIGALPCEEEKNKNAEMIRFFEKFNCKLCDEIKSKGDLTLKILLAVGAAIVVLLW